MQEELRRINTIGDSQGILHFASTILKGDEIKRESARQICSFVNDMRINFSGAVTFFEYLGFISVSENSLIPTDEGKKLYSLLGGGFEEMLCMACLNKIIADTILDTNALRFDVLKERYHIQKHGFPIAAAVFRNVLIQLHALSERQDGSLELSEHYESLFAKVRKSTKRKLSLEALKKQMEQQEQQGEAAEEYVLKYETTRLASSPIVQKIKRISDIDVSAGFDIVSFEGEASSEYDRFIEVKSYTGQPHFYWSKNEIEVATLYGDKYYLYLVNADSLNQPDYSPTVIRNPAKSVIESDGWLMQPTSYFVLPAGE
ncbi:MAG: hypothetical protein BGN88_08410 [Clostridiales bacterium 43-6]|nr:MAG: hypothetical protein BGN88_08410 [Clostridiales bacterium 43-6]